MPNAKVERQKKIKAKLKVTIHPNMSVPDILDAWDRIPDGVKSLLPPPLVISISTARTVYGLAGTVRTTYVTAKDIYNTCSEAIEAGVATIGGQPQQPALLGAAKVAKVAEKQINDQVNSMAINLVGGVVDALPNLP